VCYESSGEIHCGNITLKHVKYKLGILESGDIPARKGRLEIDAKYYIIAPLIKNSLGDLLFEPALFSALIFYDQVDTIIVEYTTDKEVKQLGKFNINQKKTIVFKVE